MEGLASPMQTVRVVASAGCALIADVNGTNPDYYNELLITLISILL